MARRKKHRGHPNPIRKWLKRIGSGIATGLKLGPVLVPAAAGIKVGLDSGPERGIHEFVLQASGFNTDTNGVDMPTLQGVIVRDIALFGAGTLLSWFVRRA